MEAPKTIEHQIGGIQNDALRFGLHGVKSDLVGAHPVESALESAKVTQEQINRKILGYTYGSAFPLKMDLERQILSRFQRPAGPIPSSMLGLEAMTGRLDDFGFEDYLNDPGNLKPSGLWTHIMQWKFALDFQRVQSPQALCDPCRLPSRKRRIVTWRLSCMGLYFDANVVLKI